MMDAFEQQVVYEVTRASKELANFDKLDLHIIDC